MFPYTEVASSPTRGVTTTTAKGIQFHIETVLLVVSSVLLAIALTQRHTLASCHWPLAIWLGVLCKLAYAFAAAFAIGRFVEGGEDWWFIEPRFAAAKVAFRATWSVLLPLASVWTLLGAWWLIDTVNLTPECFESTAGVEVLSPLFFAIVLVCSFLVALLYLCMLGCVWDASRNRMTNAAAIDAVSDKDLGQRWGQLIVSSARDLQGGLRPEDLAELPHMVHQPSAEDQCVICLTELEAGDVVRVLPSCRHTFHRPCIDLWLLRNSRCPLCNAAACGDCMP